MLLFMGHSPMRSPRQRVSRENYAQKHYSIAELADLWKLSPQALAPLFLMEPGVLIVSSKPPQISIPESVASAVYSRLRSRASTTGPFDVVLAHNSKDKPSVEAIARLLRRRGLNVWFDKWDIPPGRVFQREIDSAVRTARSIAVFVGRHGLGPWEEMEMEAAIGQFVKRKAPVIPTLLPRAHSNTTLPLMLDSFSRVRFKTLDDKEAIADLVWGITGMRKP